LSAAPVVGPVAWPRALAELRHAIALDEVASTLRHTALNDLAGMGALIYRLRRAIESSELGSDPDIAGVLRTLDTRIANAPAKLALRFMPPPARPASAELGAAARSVAAALAGGAAIDTAGLGDAERWAAVPRDELEVAFGCLLENAIEATSLAGQGTIAIAATDVPAGVALEVRDDAELIDAARAERLFDPFFSTRPGRAGLGLKIARAIAHRWEGELLLARAAPRGLIARLELPRAKGV
jgi:signal transduction histidine kinase